MAGLKVNVCFVVFHLSFQPAAHVQLACSRVQVAMRPKVVSRLLCTCSDWSTHTHTQSLLPPPLSHSSQTYTPIQTLRGWSVSPPLVGRVNDQEGPICLSFSCLFFIRTWLHLNNNCLLINFAPVLTLGHIPSHSLRRKRSRPQCSVICYAVKHLMDVHLVFESSSCSSGACLLCTSRLQ